MVPGHGRRADRGCGLVPLQGVRRSRFWLCQHPGRAPTLAQAGLGLALLLHAFGEFFRRGYRKVSLGVDAQNITGALRLYEKAGMHVIRQMDMYEKEIRPGRELRVQEIGS